jgi:hypothetical protein
MVRRFYSNPLLKGLPGRGFKHSVKHHESGRRRSVPNPNGPVFRDCPHLAFFTAEEFDELDAMLKERNSGFKRKSANGTDPLRGVPRKRTRYPGQCSTCWYCGHHHVFGGNGIADHLMCSNSREWKCWNSVGYDGDLAVARTVAFVTDELYKLDGFDDQYREMVSAALSGDRGNVVRRREQLAANERTVRQLTTNFQAAIAEYGPKPMFQAKIDEIEALERQVTAERRALDRIDENRVQVPESLLALRAMLEDEFRQLTHESYELGDLLRKIVIDFRVHLVRLCDGGHLLPRAHVKLALDEVITDAAQITGLGGLLLREKTLDLFVPPQRDRIREEAVRLAGQGLGPKAIAEQIAERPTETAVQNALALDRLMKQMGLTTPYVFVTEPPDDYAKMRRHKNAKYKFIPLDGYAPPAL